MKILFVGEGTSDIGPSEYGEEPRRARGVVPALVARLVALGDDQSIAIAWTEIARFHPSGKKRGFEAKVTAALLIAARRFGCGGTICVVDQDRDETRLPAMLNGRSKGLALVPAHHCVCGVAIQSIEAWTLGAPSAVAAVVGRHLDDILANYPNRDIEELYELSGKPELRPKGFLASLVKAGMNDLEFREAVAAGTDVSELAARCPNGFAPFANAVRQTFTDTA